MRFDPKTGTIVDDEQITASQAVMEKPGGMTYAEERAWAAGQESQKQLDLYEEAKLGKRDAIAQDPGQFFDELGNIAGNTFFGLATDAMDLVAGVGDIAVQTGSLLTGNGFDANEIFNDSDNPWTQWRRQEFAYTTDAGAAVGNLSRMASMLVGMPAFGIKGAAMLPKAAKLLKVPGAAKAAGALDKADDFLKASRLGKGQQAALGVLEEAGSKAGKIAKADDWLNATYKAVATADKGGEVTKWWGSVKDSTKALTQLTREKGRVRTLAEAVAWDAFAAFNVYGEGDYEFDETLNDMLASNGLPSIPGLTTSATDSGLVLKIKQMTEGLLMGGVINAALDMSRVYRFSRAFSKADAAEKELIVKAFNADAQEIGTSIAKSLEFDPRTVDMGPGLRTYQPATVPYQAPYGPFGAPQGPAAPALQGPQQIAPPLSQVDQLIAQAESQRIANRLQVDMDTIDRVQADQAIDDLMPPSAGGNPAADQFSQAQQFDQTVADATPPQLDNPALAQFQQQGPRPVDAFSPPEEIKAAVQMDLQSFDMTELLPEQVIITAILDKLVQILPQKRVDRLDYVKKFAPRANSTGTIDAVDSIWMNSIANQSLEEGWGAIDSNTMDIKFNRQAALDFDKGELEAKKAAAWDEATAVEQFNAKPVQQADEAVQPAQADDAAEAVGDVEADPAFENAARNEATAETEIQQLEASEAARLSDPQARSISGELTDEEVVREFNGRQLADVEVPTVQKAEGRGWEVIGPDGEVIDTAPTKKAAVKKAEAEAKKAQDAEVAAARQKQADGTPEAVEVGIGDPIAESTVMGKVKLTGRQMQSVNELIPSLKSQFNPEQVARTAKNFDLTLTEMGQLAEAISQKLAAGGLDRNETKVLKNVLDKLDTSSKVLQEQARLKAHAVDIDVQTNRFLTHGDNC